jgi:hypothetical protein
VALARDRSVASVCTVTSSACVYLISFSEVPVEARILWFYCFWYLVFRFLALTCK